MTETRDRIPATLHPTAFVARGAVVVGDVTLDARSSVWFGSVVRGDSDRVIIGESSNIQDGSVVHMDEGQPALLGARITVGHGCILHGCVIEDECLIGMGSVVLTGARIGSGSLIGAGSLLREGQIVPPGSLAFGSPARVAGPVGPRHRAAIEEGWRHYAELARRYLLAGLGRGADPHGVVGPDRGPMGFREWRELLRAFEACTTESVGRGRDPAARDRQVARDRQRLRLVEALIQAPECAWPEDGDAPDLLGTQAKDHRERLASLLRNLGPEHWRHVAGHPRRGPLSLADLLREWVDEDLEPDAAGSGA